MKKIFSTFALILFQLSFSITAQAVPIPDGVTSARRVGWFPSVNTPCPNVCAARGLTAERYGFSVPALGNTVAYACRAKYATAAAPSPGSLHGNNFNSPNYARTCTIATMTGSVQRANSFHCLCSRLARGEENVDEELNE